MCPVGLGPSELIVIHAGSEGSVHEILQYAAPPVVADDDEELLVSIAAAIVPMIITIVVTRDHCARIE